MRKPKTFSRQPKTLVKILATSLFLLSLSALLVIFIFQQYLHFRTYQAVISNSQSLIANETAKTVSEFIKEKITVLHNVVWVSDPNNKNTDDKKILLQSILGIQPSFRAIALYDDYSHEKVLISRRSNASLNNTGEEYFSEALEYVQENNSFISPVYIDRITFEPLIIIAVPIHDPLHKFKGLMYAELNLKFMWDLVDELKIGRTGYAYVVDRKGNLIAFGDAAKVLKNEDVKMLEPVRQFINNAQTQGDNDLRIYEGLKETSVVGTYIPLITPDWAVIIELPVKEAYKQIFIELSFGSALLILIAFGIGFFGYYRAKRLSIPIINLMHTASKIADGNRNIKAKVEGPLEVVALADAFNSMTGQLNNIMSNLEKQIEEVKTAEKALLMSQYSIDEAMDAVFWMNREGGFTYVNNTASYSLGYSKEELLNLKLWDIDPVYGKDQWEEEWDSYLYNTEGYGKRLETTYQRKDGTQFPVETASKHIWFDDVELHVVHVRDISERKIAENALKLKNEELDRFFTSTLDLLCIADTDGYFRRLNKEWEIALGYKIEDLIDKNFLELVHPDDLDATKSAVSNLANQIEVLNFINRYRAKNGDYKWLEWRSYPSGKLIYATARDITEKKIAEEKLLISQFTIDQSMDAVFWMNKQGGFSYVNEQACRSLGYSCEELLKMHLWDIDPVYPKSQWFTNWDLFQLNRQGGAEKIETFHRRKDGSIFPVEVYARHIWFGDVEFHVANVRDITERKQAENELRNKETQLSITLKIASLGYWEFDFDNDKFRFNDLFYSLYRTDAETEGGYNLTTRQYLNRFVHPDDIFIVSEKIKGVFKTNEIHFHEHFEHKVIFRNAEIGYVVVRYYVDKNPEGELLKVYGVNQDITERKKFEQAIIDAKEEAEKSNRLKSDFLAQMSHEIRTPINTILNFTSLLEAELQDQVNGELFESFKIIDGASRRLIRTIDLILNMSQIQTGTYECYYRKFDLYESIIKNLYDEYKNISAHKGIQLKINQATSDSKIFADEYTVMQIFDNLLNNAFKYTSSGFIEIGIFGNIPNKLIVEISDTGVGISKEFLPNLFQPFMQEEGGYTRKYEGNGLGLALVKKYCDLNKASIEVESEKAKGTVFRVIFDKAENIIFS